MNVQKEARRDAKEFARAQMYYGEGAGTRRKLIIATVEDRANRSPEYARAFRQELDRQDMAEHAVKARRERFMRDKTHSADKNLRGLISGDYRSVNTGVVIVLAVGYFAHQTGVDRVIYMKAKQTIDDFKARRQARKLYREVIVFNHKK